jgi:hypothetical protein
MNQPAESKWTWRDIPGVIALLLIFSAAIYVNAPALYDFFNQPKPRTRAVVRLRGGERIQTVKGVTTDGWLTECDTGNQRHIVGDYAVVHDDPTDLPVVCVNEPHYKEWIKAITIANLPHGWKDGVRQPMDYEMAMQYVRALDGDRDKVQQLANANGWLTGNEARIAQSPQTASTSTKDTPLWVGIVLWIGLLAFVGVIARTNHRKPLSKRTIALALIAVITPLVAGGLWIIFN